ASGGRCPRAHARGREKRTGSRRRAGLPRGGKVGRTRGSRFSAVAEVLDFCPEILKGLAGAGREGGELARPQGSEVADAMGQIVHHLFGPVRGGGIARRRTYGLRRGLRSGGFGLRGLAGRRAGSRSAVGGRLDRGNAILRGSHGSGGLGARGLFVEAD